MILYQTDRLLKCGANVVLACRDANKIAPLVSRWIKMYPNQKVDHIPLDLSDFDSVRDFVKQFNLKYPKLDILINNAGIKQKTSHIYMHSLFVSLIRYLHVSIRFDKA